MDLTIIDKVGSSHTVKNFSHIEFNNGDNTIIKDSYAELLICQELDDLNGIISFIGHNIFHINTNEISSVL